MKPFPWRCGTCGERMVEPATVSPYLADLDHDGRKYQVKIESLRVFRCAHCGAVMLDDEADEKLSAELRAAVGLLTPEQIRNEREALGLTQKELASLLSISESTLSRWETGGQIQQRCMDRFLRGVFRVTELQEFLRKCEASRAETLPGVAANPSIRQAM